MRRGGLRGLVVAAALALAPGVHAAPAPCFDYVYVDASEGGSSGGHTAIRFDDEVYHFQHDAGLSRLRREPWSHFLFRYGLRDNRTIHLSHVTSPEGTCAWLRDRFAARHLIQDRQLEHLAALRRDGTLLAALGAHTGERAAPLAVRGAGFFPQDDAPAARSPALAALRARVVARYGAAVVSRRAAEVADAARRLRPESEALPLLTADEYPLLPATFAERWEALAAAHTALRVLDAAPALAPGALTPPISEAPLTASERQALARSAARLVDGLVPLLAPGRLDWGFALLVGMARLAAIEAALERGRLVVLDAWPAAPEVIDHSTVERYHAAAPLLVEAERRVEAARAALATSADGVGEAELSALEDAGGRRAALIAVIEEGRDLPVSADRLVPARTAAPDDVTRPALSAAELRAAAPAAGDRVRTYQGELDRLWGYNVVTRNCVSEIFHTIDAALESDAPADPVAASAARLGGHVDTRWSLRFIPWVSAIAVDRTYAVAGDEELPSYRKARLAALSRAASRLGVYLRESNVLTSTLYRRNPDDSLFVFFTDDAVSPRPVFGAVNLLVGTGASALGVVLAPFDGGRLLVAGLRGALWSLPELAFVNIRKGTFPFLPPAAAGAGG